MKDKQIKEIHELIYLWFNNQKYHIYGMYKARHCTSSKSYEHIHEYSEKNTLGSDQVNFKISECFSYMPFYFTKLDLKFQGYVDDNLADDIDNKKSTIWFVYTLGNITVYWVSYKRLIVFLLYRLNM